MGPEGGGDEAGTTAKGTRRASEGVSERIHKRDGSGED